MSLHLHKYTVLRGDAICFYVRPERIICAGSDRYDLLGKCYVRIMLTVENNAEGTGSGHLDRIIDKDIYPLDLGYHPVKPSVKGFAFESVIPEEGVYLASMHALDL